MPMLHPMLILAVSLLLLSSSALADPGTEGCPTKAEAAVFRVGIMSPVTAFAVPGFLAVDAVNENAIPSLGCFGFNLTVYSGDAPDEPVCADDPSYSFATAVTVAGWENDGCDPSRLCYPTNTIWQNSECSAERAPSAAEALLEDGVVAVLGPICSDSAVRRVVTVIVAISNTSR